jgi:hypothetical protein
MLTSQTMAITTMAMTCGKPTPVFASGPQVVDHVSPVAHSAWIRLPMTMPKRASTLDQANQ